MMRAEVEHVWLTCCRMAENGNIGAGLAFASTLLGMGRITRDEYLALIERPIGRFQHRTHPLIQWARDTIVDSVRDTF